LLLTLLSLEKKKRNKLKLLSETISTSNAPANALGDNNDILAGLKAEMEKSEKKK